VIARHLRCGGLAVSLFALSPHAHADGAADARRAEQLFAEASALVDRGEVAAACPKLEESQRLDPALGTQYNLALCYEKIGRLGAAWRNFQAVERLAHAAGKAGREEAAHQRLGELKPRITHLVLRTPDAGVTFKVDGTTVERGEQSFFVVDPGEHVVDASAPGKRPWQARVSVGEARLEAIVDAPALDAPRKDAGQGGAGSDDGGSGRRTLGWAIGGLGVVGLGVATVTGILVLGAKATADSKCTPTCVDQDGRDAVSRGKTLVPINAVAWGVGIVGVGVGLFLVLTSGPSGSASASRVHPSANGIDVVF
jgi:hypothetical protein